MQERGTAMAWIVLFSAKIQYQLEWGKAEGAKRPRPFFNFNLSVCLSVGRSVCQCVCVTFVVFADCESCKGPISTNPESMEAGGYEITRGTCCFARRLELVTVAGLLWISWCALGAAEFFVFFPRFFFLVRTHTACCKYEAALHH